MAWTAPTTRTTGELITAAIWNTDIVDNLNILKSPPTDYQTIDEATDYQTNSTVWVDVDSTDLSKSITLAVESDIFIFFGSAMVNFNADGNVYLNVLMDGITDLADDDGITGLTRPASSISTARIPIGFTRIVRSVAAGPHTFKLRWKVVGATTATMYATNVHPQFTVREVS
jgi:hypothetical protein